jgi:hypothetical protein
MNNSLPTKIVLHGFARRISIARQVLDGPPGDATRRLSSFLLIPVGFHRQGFADVDLHRLQKTLFGDAGDAPVGQQIEVPISRLDHGQPHRLTAFDAGHLDGGLKARAGRRRPGYLRHRAQTLKRRHNATHSDQRSTANMSDSRHNWNKASPSPMHKKFSFQDRRLRQTQAAPGCTKPVLRPSALAHARPIAKQ